MIVIIATTASVNIHSVLCLIYAGLYNKYFRWILSFYSSHSHCIIIMPSHREKLQISMISASPMVTKPGIA